MGKQITTFCDIEVEKYKIHQYKNPISIYDTNIGRVVVSSKVPFGKKSFEYFIGYEDDSEKIYVLKYNASKNECIKSRF